MVVRIRAGAAKDRAPRREGVAVEARSVDRAASEARRKDMSKRGGEEERLSGGGATRAETGGVERAEGG